MSQELLQQLVTNTTPAETSMITISSTNPKFRVNFPSPIPVKEIALGKLRVYNSWPNIRSVTFGDQQPNNSLVFANKNKPDGTPDWQTVYIPTGSYEIEQINDEFQRRIKSITGKDSKIAISVHEPTLSSSIEISTEGYAVDIYNSSIRTVLGWPEIPPETEFIDIPKPVKSDYITAEIGPDNPTKSYKDSLDFEAVLGPAPFSKSTVNLLDQNFKKMIDDLNLLLPSLKSGKLTRDEFISVVSAGNKIIDDMEKANKQIIKPLTDEKPLPRSNPLFLLPRVNPLSGLASIIVGYNLNKQKEKLNNAIDEGFQVIYNAWETKKQRQLKFLTHNNSPDGGGRHIAPNNVDISKVIALNLICDAIEGSYQTNLTHSEQAQQGYILYSFAPSVSPGYLLKKNQSIQYI